MYLVVGSELQEAIVTLVHVRLTSKLYLSILCTAQASNCHALAMSLLAHLISRMRHS
jgi:hypothetical protein